MLFIEYPKCSTCKKAKKYLEVKHIKFTDRNNNLQRLIEKKEANSGYEFVESFVKYTYTGDTISVGEGEGIETITGSMQPEDKIEITYTLKKVD